MMTYQETIDYLYHAAPLFQNIGAGAYKEGLSNTMTLDEHFNHPHRTYRTLHVAGTNGKGSVSSTLAAILQSCGLRVGLYTSPHLEDFRERIRVNGEMIPEQRVIDFVEQERVFFQPLYPSFFELTTALAFLYFAEQKVDVAIIEVGLGGRLDCTNIITPDLSVITNISFDHQQFLGDTLAKIAAEKAGIMKSGVPVVIGETNGHHDVRDLFANKAAEKGCTIRFADEEIWTEVESQLVGCYQRANMNTVQCVVDELRKDSFYAPLLSKRNVREGFLHICDFSGLRGRWQVVNTNPMTICDVGHNVAGIEKVVQQLSSMSYPSIHVIFGMVDDKDYQQAITLLGSLGARADFYMTQPSSQRALAAEVLAEEAKRQGLHVRACKPILKEAVEAARADAHPDDLLFIGGSCYLIADYFVGTR